MDEELRHKLFMEMTPEEFEAVKAAIEQRGFTISQDLPEGLPAFYRLTKLNLEAGGWQGNTSYAQIEWILNKFDLEEVGISWPRPTAFREVWVTEKGYSTLLKHCDLDCRADGTTFFRGMPVNVSDEFKDIIGFREYLIVSRELIEAPLDERTP